jgi:hypothetical protein
VSTAPSSKGSSAPGAFRRRRGRSIARVILAATALAVLCVALQAASRRSDPDVASAQQCAPAHRAAPAAFANQVRPEAVQARLTAAGTAGFAGGGSMHKLKRATLKRDLDAMARTGARWLRFDINWNVVQCRGPRSWNWAPSDRVVAAARARGIEVLALITYTPAWARPAGTTSKYAPDPTQ